MSKNYVKCNKEAWEEAFNESTNTFKENSIQQLKKDPKSLFTKELKALLETDAESSKVIAHFCCNNGRETLAALVFGYKQSVGFDIAENMISFANNVANDLGLPAQFYATNILEMDSKFNQSFDTIMFTVGAITWFEDPKELFEVVGRCLKKGGTLIIEDIHPFANQLATSNEEGYNQNDPKKLVHSYFKSTPWVELGSMGYMTGKDEGSKTFYSHSHALSSLMMGILENGMKIDYFVENQVCQANLFSHLNHTGVPLTYLLRAYK